MKLYLERHDGKIHVQKKVDMPLGNRNWFRTFKSVDDTPANYKDLQRWAEVVGHTLEER